jgi:hypothetical protein
LHHGVKNLPMKNAIHYAGIALAIAAIKRSSEETTVVRREEVIFAALNHNGARRTCNAEAPRRCE